MRMLIIAGALALTGCMTTSSAPPAASAADYATALADSARPESDRARDAARHPAEILAFANIRPGNHVADFVMGGGYFTRLMATAVGATGRVYAFQPTEFVRFQASYGENLRTVDAAYDNVTGIEGPFAAPTFPEPLDVILTVQNFHDLHLTPFPAGSATRASAALFNALRPGGLLVVIDHSAVAGSGVRDANGLHRIDVDEVKRELAGAGFVLDGESDLLRMPADPRTTNVFDPTIRGRTDQFMLRFRRPLR